jgi:hypothetical protein
MVRGKSAIDPNEGCDLLLLLSVSIEKSEHRSDLHLVQSTRVVMVA